MSKKEKTKESDNQHNFKNSVAKMYSELESKHRLIRTELSKTFGRSYTKRAKTPSMSKMKGLGYTLLSPNPQDR